MIKNIVFDMGRVLVGYDENRVCDHYITDKAEKEKIRASIFYSQEWVLLDMGVITEEDALERMLSRLDTEHEKELAKLCMEHWNEECMWTMPETRDIVPEMKKRGYGIYLCSNASLRLPQCYKKFVPHVECFDGILFSAEEKLLKPQVEIYYRLFEKFNLKPEECFFIDDSQINIDGARTCHMDGYCFADGDADKLKDRLYRHLS